MPSQNTQQVDYTPPRSVSLVIIPQQRETITSVEIRLPVAPLTGTEGRGGVINSLLEPSFQQLIDSVIVTVAPTWLGEGGVVVSPKRRIENGKAIAASRLTSVAWQPFGEDVVLCGRIKV
jgi:hypothetical protein